MRLPQKNCRPDSHEVEKKFALQYRLRKKDLSERNLPHDNFLMRINATPKSIAILRVAIS